MRPIYVRVSRHHPDMVLSDSKDFSEAIFDALPGLLEEEEICKVIEATRWSFRSCSVVASSGQFERKQSHSGRLVILGVKDHGHSYSQR
ncbi:hypothetical protein [Paraburkholderia saeva]|uniref:hypothetical protein n=1 Tax=Paraburkholderia saeva TaxID=2777537 RepID=UPI001DDE5F60|nr:hypothetical protein [Paraburkholderia saeva]CAG4916139.1 hypothetical protein R70241_04418 [Paraburkholderia saeva]